MAVIVTTFPDAAATSYASVATLRAWAAQRLKDLGAATDDQLGVVLNEASEYMDIRFRFRGLRKDHAQAREFPRDDLYDERGYAIEGVPQEVQDACCAYAFLRRGGVELMPDPDYDSTGQAVKSKSEEVGPIKESVTYVEAAGFRLPTFPSIDRLLYRRRLTCEAGGISVGSVGRA